MRKTILSLALAALFVAPSLAPALEVPAGKAAVIEAVVGKVSVTADKKETKAKVGQVLEFGSSLSTGINGRLSLRHADNAVTRLAPNTELTLNAPGAKKGIFLSLGKGLIRFLVGKRAPGESFEVTTSNAVAAVKGTDAEVRSDGKKTASTVFESSHEKALQFIDSKTGKSQDLAPGQTSELDENGFNTRELTQEERNNSQQQYDGLPAPEVKEEQGNGQGGDEQGGGKDEQAEGPKDDDTMREGINDAFADVMADMEVDNLIERDDRTGDLAAGRIAYDRNGDRTQISSYVLRVDDKTIAKSSYSQRETGPFAGTTFAEEATTWNATLPEDWASIARNYLNSPANTDVNGEPIFWRASQYFRAGNPQGDLMEVERYFQRPYFNAYTPDSGITYYRNYLMSQGFEQYLSLNGTQVQYLDWRTDPTYYDNLRVSDPSIPTLLADYPQLQSLSYSNYTYDSNGYYFDYALTSESPLFLQTEVRVLTQEGAIVDPWNVVQTEPTALRHFRGIDNSLSIELTFKSTMMSAPIDLLLIPEIFDNFDFFDMPGDEFYVPRTNEVPCDCAA